MARRKTYFLAARYAVEYLIVKNGNLSPLDVPSTRLDTFLRRAA